MHIFLAQIILAESETTKTVITYPSWDTCIPWIISLLGIGVTAWIAFQNTKIKKALNGNEKKIERIDTMLKELREDYSLFVTSAGDENPKKALANMRVAYDILATNPLSTEAVKTSSKRMLTYTTRIGLAAMRLPNKQTDEKNSEVDTDTYEKAMEDLGTAYREIVESKNIEREQLIS